MSADMGRDEASRSTPLPGRGHQATSFQRTWKFICICLLLSVHEKIDSEVFMPFLYSRVRCCPPSLPVEYVLVAAEATAAGGCGILYPPGSANWTHSRHCSNLNYVRDT
eukprot:COSAG01_NODE_28936_length_649_cov_1.001818_1_plen_108_part_10